MPVLVSVSVLVLVLVLLLLLSLELGLLLDSLLAGAPCLCTSGIVSGGFVPLMSSYSAGEQHSWGATSCSMGKVLPMQERCCE